MSEELSGSWVVGVEAQQLFGDFHGSHTVTGLGVEGGEPEEDIGIGRVYLRGSLEGLDRLSKAAGAVEADAEYVRVARFVGVEPGGASQRVECRLEAAESHESETEGVMEVGVVRSSLKGLSQECFTFCVSIEAAIQIGEIDVGRQVLRLELERLAIVPLRGRGVALLCRQCAEVELCVGPFGVDELRGSVLAEH